MQRLAPQETQTMSREAKEAKAPDIRSRGRARSGDSGGLEGSFS